MYEAPLPASIDDVTHLRWKGLMDGTFVRSVIDTVMYAFLLSSSLFPALCPSFLLFTFDRVDAMWMADVGLP